MDSMVANLEERLRKLEPRLRRLMEITGIPGCSIGIIHMGVEVCKLNLGLSDVENNVAARSDTVLHLNSLTKSITAAAFACLVKDGKVNWDTPIKSIIPEFGRTGDALDQTMAAIDLMSMRSGHHSFNCFAWQGTNTVLPDKGDTIEYWNATPRVGSSRDDFSYNNWGYGVVTLVIEKLSGQPFHQFLQERIFDPLYLNRTKMQDDLPFDNTAASYATLDERSPVRIPSPKIGAGVFTEGGSGVLSTVDDMLCLYLSYLRAINDQFNARMNSTIDNPFVECTTILAPHNSLRVDGAFREQTYACGWVRAQLPGPLGMIGMNAEYTRMPTVLEGGRSLLCFYHQGMMAGSTSNIALIPETETVIAVLANSSYLGDGTDWMSQMIIEEIFEAPNRNDYAQYAMRVAGMIRNHIPNIGKELQERHISGTTTSCPIEAYVGTFKHTDSPFKIDIHLDSDRDQLAFTFNGKEEETYELRHYQDDVFEWWVPLDDAARRGRFIFTYRASTFLFSFQGTRCFTWVSGDIEELPYVFARVE